jgi:hypothetical protein
MSFSTAPALNIVAFVPGDTSYTIPDGFTTMIVKAIGAGGAGGVAVGQGAGGGGGGFCYYSTALDPADTGATLTLAVGAGASATNGGNTTISGTLVSGAFSLAANGGAKGVGLGVGSGGSASGGSLNYSGNDGEAGPDGGQGGSSTAANDPDPVQIDCVTFGFGGAGDTVTSNAGLSGTLQLEFT